MRLSITGITRHQAPRRQQPAQSPPALAPSHLGLLARTTASNLSCRYLFALSGVPGSLTITCFLVATESDCFRQLLPVFASIVNGEYIAATTAASTATTTTITAAPTSENWSARPVHAPEKFYAKRFVVSVLWKRFFILTTLFMPSIFAGSGHHQHSSWRCLALYISVWMGRCNQRRSHVCRVCAYLYVWECVRAFTWDEMIILFRILFSAVIFSLFIICTSV